MKKILAIGVVIYLFLTIFYVGKGLSKQPHLKKVETTDCPVDICVEFEAVEE